MSASPQVQPAGVTASNVVVLRRSTDDPAFGQMTTEVNTNNQSGAAKKTASPPAIGPNGSQAILLQRAASSVVTRGVTLTNPQQLPHKAAEPSPEEVARAQYLLAQRQGSRPQVASREAPPVPVRAPLEDRSSQGQQRVVSPNRVNYQRPDLRPITPHAVVSGAIPSRERVVVELPLFKYEPPPMLKDTYFTSEKYCSSAVSDAKTVQNTNSYVRQEERWGPSWQLEKRRNPSGSRFSREHSSAPEPSAHYAMPDYNTIVRHGAVEPHNQRQDKYMSPMRSPGHGTYRLT